MPLVSVIMPAYYSHKTIESSLQALEAQTFRDFEVIVVDSTPDGRTVNQIASSFPRINVYHHGQRLLPHAARNYGAAVARGEILVFTDPDCRANPDWLGWLVAAHRDRHEATGGAVESVQGWWNTALHMTKYGWWLPRGRPGTRPQIPTANCSYSRSIWNAVGPFQGKRYAGDSELNWRLQARGQEIWFEPRAVVTHMHPAGFAEFLGERYRRGQDFGLTRVRGREWSRPRCLLYLLLVPLLPWLMAFRAARYATGGYIRDWLLTLPVQLWGYTAWCAGEATSHWKMFWTR